MAEKKRRRTDLAEPLRLSEKTRAALIRHGPPIWSINDRRAILRELIAHEDKLTGERIQALYTLQGLLFTSVGLLSRAELFTQWTIRGVITLIAVVGVTSPRFYWQELQNSEAAIDQVLCDWDDVGQIFPDETYPRLIGYIAAEKQRAPSWLPRRAVPALLMFVWLGTVLVI
jgi:hypothetical protein